jgi:hypothetical protein
MSYGGLVFEIECQVCGHKFTVPAIYSMTPRHPPKGEDPSPYPYIAYSLCFGSGKVGINLSPKTQGVV